MLVTAIIAAGGSGTRLGDEIPKQFLDLDGKPIIAWSLEAFSRANEISEIVVVAPLDYLKEVEQYAKKAIGQRLPFKVVPGGATRQESVKNGLLSASSQMEWIAVHDAARPFVSPYEIDALCLMARELGAAILGKKVIDTIKQVEDGIITKTIDRSKLVAALTPQVCKKKDLFMAYQKAKETGFVATDEASLLEFAGINVAVHFGSSFNFKITTKEDLIMARAISGYIKDKLNG